MPQNSNCRLPVGHRFGPKFDFKVMAPNHGGDPLGSILGPMGSQKWVKTIKIPCPKFRILDYILGPMGSRWVKKWVKTVKNYHAPKFEFSTTPRSLISTKIRLFYGYGAKSRWGTPRDHLGANGVSLGPKRGQNRKKLPCPKIRIFDYPAVIDFHQNSTLRLWRQITVGTP